MPDNVFVLGLDEHNQMLLEALPDADRYRFHPLLTIEELQYELQRKFDRCAEALPFEFDEA